MTESNKQRMSQIETLKFKSGTYKKKKKFFFFLLHYPIPGCYKHFFSCLLKVTFFRRL